MLFNTKTLMIDPPSGWRYGFPKPVPEHFFSEGFDLGGWLITCGYPVADIPLALKYSRYWEIDND
jgi:hypothetical protein